MIENKVAIITGGTRGIGLEIVRLFKENGAKVILFGSREETVNKALEYLKNDNLEVDGYYPNLNDFDSVKKTVEEIIAKYGRIDILVNNAGISANKKIEETSVSDFTSIMNLNVNAIFHMIKAVVPFMKENGGGVILNTSSMVSIYGQPSGVGYPTSKFAINGMTKSLALELGKYNIRVNAIMPGYVKTPMVNSMAVLSNEANPKSVIDGIVAGIPMGRLAEPEEIGELAAFLACEESSYITAQGIVIDGASTLPETTTMGA